jgi:hypothetical protein
MPEEGKGIAMAPAVPAAPLVPPNPIELILREGADRITFISGNEK